MVKECRRRQDQEYTFAVGCGATREFDKVFDLHVRPLHVTLSLHEVEILFILYMQRLH